jgi:uncharacterized membrane protein YhfC
VLHLPFNFWVLTPGLGRLGFADPGSLRTLLVVGLLFGLSAGLFEEIARYLVLRYWLHDARSWREALMFGAGHGGIEAILLGGIAMYGFFQAVAYRNADLSTLVPPEQLQMVQGQLQVYWAQPWFAALLGALERSFALCIHLGASILVLQVFNRGNLIWLMLAIGWHTIVNAIAVISLPMWGVAITMGLIGLAAALSLVMVFALRGVDEDKPPGVMAPPSSELLIDKAPVVEEQIPDERLEDSRFL